MTRKKKTSRKKEKKKKKRKEEEMEKAKKKKRKNWKLYSVMIVIRVKIGKGNSGALTQTTLTSYLQLLACQQVADLPKSKRANLQTSKHPANRSNQLIKPIDHTNQQTDEQLPRLKLILLLLPSILLLSY